MKSMGPNSAQESLYQNVWVIAIQSIIPTSACLALVVAMSYTELEDLAFLHSLCTVPTLPLSHDSLHRFPHLLETIQWH